MKQKIVWQKEEGKSNDEKVLISGTFCNWVEKVPLVFNEEENKWEIEISFEKYVEFKFVINGEFTTSEDYEIVHTDQGACNIIKEMNETADWKPPAQQNQIKVEEKALPERVQSLRASLGGSGGRSELTKSILEYLSLDPNCVHCPNPKCTNIFENAGPGADEPADLLLNGKPISEEAKNHRSSFRFRCRECSLEFCSKCGESPYHLGYTCDSFRQFLDGVKCRFCDDPLEYYSIHDREVAIHNKREVTDYCADCASYALKCFSFYYDGCLHTKTASNTMVNDPGCINPLCLVGSGQTDEDDCVICYSPIKSQPWVRSSTCNHIFHDSCIRRRATEKGPSYISFTKLECPICGELLNFLLAYGDELNAIFGVDVAVTDIAFRLRNQFKIEEIEIPKDVVEKGTDWSLVKFGLSKFNYYSCSVCKSNYFGGKKECGENIDIPDQKLICLGCNGCKIHGPDDMIFKCRFCCSPATWFCFGHTHFCEPCHNMPWEIVNGDNNQYIHYQVPICPGPEKCPLGIPHPPNGEEFPLGCVRCSEDEIQRNLKKKAEEKKNENNEVKKEEENKEEKKEEVKKEEKKEEVKKEAIEEKKNLRQRRKPVKKNNNNNNNNNVNKRSKGDNHNKRMDEKKLQQGNNAPKENQKGKLDEVNIVEFKSEEEKKEEERIEHEKLEARAAEILKVKYDKNVSSCLCPPPPQKKKKTSKKKKQAKK